MRIIKQRLLELIPDLRVFLDVDGTAARVQRGPPHLPPIVLTSLASAAPLG